MRVGTCSWKYDSWKGLIYPDFGEFNYLEEYSKHYNTVEIDQWFWSLNKDNAYLPKPNTGLEYNESTPDDFKFTIKIPNSLTLTHPYKSTTPNQYFLSAELMKSFIHSIEPLLDKVGVLMFQFEYLNKQKMNSLAEFIDKFHQFRTSIDQSIPIGIEIRNPNYLKKEYFQFLIDNNIAHVFLQGYYMPSILDVYGNFSELIKEQVIIRLHGYDRDGIEEKTKKVWDKIVEPKDNELSGIVKLLKDLQSRKVDIYLNVNNHYEGSAPLTISKIQEAIT